MTGWSLGEHGEWSKYSNFDVALKTPLILYVPHIRAPLRRLRYISPFEFKEKGSETVEGVQVSQLVELVDLFPTLADLSGISVPKICDKESTSSLCTEGLSLKPLIENKLTNARDPVRWKTNVFSQYPRPNLKPQENSDQPTLKDIRIMGYTMKGEQMRYTEWIEYNHSACLPNWSRVYARELYLDESDNNNVAGEEFYNPLIKKLSKELRKGWRGALPPSQ